MELKGEVRVRHPFLGIGVAFERSPPRPRNNSSKWCAHCCPHRMLALRVGAVATPSHPSLPIIVNADAALQWLVEYFENHLDLTKEVFVERVRNSQTSSR